MYTVQLFLPESAVPVFERYRQRMRGYIHPDGTMPFINQTDEELFQSAIFLGSERMVIDKLWDAAFASDAITLEEYRMRILKEQINVEGGTDNKGGAATGEAAEHIGACGQDRYIQGDNVQEDKEAEGLYGEGAAPDSVHDITDR